MYKILFLFLTLLASCAAPPKFDLIKAKSADNLECPDIHIVHAEKEFKVEQKDSNISVLSSLSVDEANCIKQNNNVQMTLIFNMTSKVTGTLKKNNVIALPLSYQVTTALHHDEKYKPLRSKIFFTAMDFTPIQVEQNFKEKRVFMLNKNDMSQEDLVIKVGFVKN